jgi:hypothetical protein
MRGPTGVARDEKAGDMVPTYNGWEDTPEDEREALELWEAGDSLPTRSSRAMPRLSGSMFVDSVSE